MNRMLLSQVFAECTLIASNDPQSLTRGEEVEDTSYAQLRTCSPQPAWNDNRFGGQTMLRFREEDGMPHAL
jgi:hypothetical protein